MTNVQPCRFCGSDTSTSAVRVRTYWWDQDKHAYLRVTPCCEICFAKGCVVERLNRLAQAHERLVKEDELSPEDKQYGNFGLRGDSASSGRFADDLVLAEAERREDDSIIDVRASAVFGETYQPQDDLQLIQSADLEWLAKAPQTLHVDKC